VDAETRRRIAKLERRNGNGVGHGNGHGDDTDKLQELFDESMESGEPVNLGGPEKTYRLTRVLTGGTNLRIRGYGAKIDYTDFPKTYSSGVATADCVAINVAGTMGAKVPLTADVVEKEYTAIVADGTEFRAGDWVQIGSEDFNPYSTSTFVPRGETKKIRSISSNTLTFTAQNYEGYTVSNSGFVRKVNFVTNFHCDGVEFIGSAVNQLTNNNRENPLTLYAVRNFSVTNNTFRDHDVIGVRVRSCILGNVTHNEIDGVFRESALSKGSVYYGIALQNTCQWVYVGQNKGQTLRRLVVNTSTQTDYGQSYHCLIQGNQFFDSHAGSDGRVEGFEHHGFGRWIAYDANMTDSALGGIRVEGRDISITNNMFVNCVGNGVMFDSDGKVFQNIHVGNNTITRATVDGTSSTGAGVWFEPPSPATAAQGALIRNITVVGNTISGFTGSGRHGMRILYDADVPAENCTIQGNHVDSNLTTIPSSGSSGILVEAPGWDVLNNKIYGYYRGVSFVTNANGNLCRGNVIKNSQIWGVASEAAVVAQGDNILVEGNYFENMAIGTRVAAEADGTKIYRNTHTNVTTQVSDSGTNTVTAYQLPSAAASIVTYKPDSDTNGTVTLPSDLGGPIVFMTFDSLAGGVTATSIRNISFAGSAGQVIIIKSATSARPVTLQHHGGGTGNMRNTGAADFVADSSSDTAAYAWTGSVWLWVAGNNG
jgi:hypothetical protein